MFLGENVGSEPTTTNRVWRENGNWTHHNQSKKVFLQNGQSLFLFQAILAETHGDSQVLFSWWLSPRLPCGNWLKIAYTLNLECTWNDQFICGWALSFSFNALCYYFAQIRPFTSMHRVGPSRLSTSVAWGPTLAPRLSPRFGLEALPAFAKDVSSGTKPSLERKVATALIHGPTGVATVITRFRGSLDSLPIFYHVFAKKNDIWRSYSAFYSQNLTMVEHILTKNVDNMIKLSKGRF